MRNHRYLIDDPILPIYIDYNEFSIEVFRPLYRFSGHTPISKSDYLTIVKSIRDVIILGEDIDFQYYRFGNIVYFIKDFCCQLFIEPDKIIFKSGELMFLHEPKALESHKKEDILKKVDSIIIRSL